MVAEKVFINGTIYTMDEGQFYAQALAVAGQMLLCVGSNEAVLQCAGPQTEVVDLKGNTVLPGLIDSHVHTLIAADKFDTEFMVHCFDKTKEEIIEAVKAMAAKKKPGEWIQGLGWNQAGWADTSMPTKEELDVVSPCNPVVLLRVCGHAYWANSLALQLAEIDRHSTPPAGSEIMKDEAGEPTGYLTELAGQAVGACVPTLSEEDIARKFLIIQQYMLENGVTSYSDKALGVSSIAAEPPVRATMTALDRLYGEGKMKVRLCTYIQPGAVLDEMYQQGPQIGLHGGRLTHRGVKMFSDGALGARSAWLSEDYSDRPGHRGSGRLTDEFLQTEMKKAHNAGFQVSLHAIGDAAVKQAMDAHEAVNPQRKDYRFLIEHFMVARDEEFRRLSNSGIIPSMQYVELSSDMNMIEKRVGTTRAMGAYAWRRILNAGVPIAAGTDLPMDVLNPYENMYYGVSRCTISEEPQGGWHPWEALTRYEVLKSYTLDAAYARFEEDVLGSLKAGKYADFVVIDRDYMNCAVKEIKDIRALMTVVGGEILYRQ